MINPCDVEELAEKIILVLKNDELRQRMKKDGLKRANIFSWQKQLHKLCKYIKSF